MFGWIDMKKACRKNYLFVFSLIYFFLFILGWFILSRLNYEYLFMFKAISTIMIILGMIGGTFQIVHHLECSDRDKISFYISYFIIEGFFSLVFLIIILFPLLSQTEKIVTIDDKKYVEIKYSFLLSNRIDYYDFENIIFRRKQPRFTKNYNNSLSETDYLGTTYYDDKGKIINKLEDNNSSDLNSDDFFEEKILYIKEIAPQTIIRVKSGEAEIGYKDVIIVEKSIDGGNSFVNQLKSQTLTVGRDAIYLFLDETIGFIKEFKDNSNKGLLVTRDGGRTFNPAQFEIDSQSLKHLYIEEMPYYERDQLKLIGSFYYSNIPEKVVMISDDQGLTWKIS